MHLSELLELIRLETTISADWDDPNYLADLLVRLASYYSSLGQLLADAERDENEAELAFKLRREGKAAEEIEGGMSAAAAEKIGVMESETERKIHIKLKHKARLFFLSRQSLEKTMDAIRSKLSYLKRDREQQ